MWRNLRTYKDLEGKLQLYSYPFGHTKHYRRFFRSSENHLIGLARHSQGCVCEAYIEQDASTVLYRHPLLESSVFKSADIYFSRGGTGLSKVVLYSDHFMPCDFVVLDFQGEVISVRSSYNSDNKFVERYTEDRVCLSDGFPGFGIYSSGANIDRSQRECVEIVDADGTTGIVFPAKVRVGVNGLVPTDVFSDPQNHDWIDIFERTRMSIDSYRAGSC